MSGLENAIHGLKQALDSPRRQHMWRWLVRNRMSTVKEALATDGAPGGDAWLAPREVNLHRERHALLAQLSALGPAVLEDDDIDDVHGALLRLVSALERHHQRVNDLVYDSVSLELGGSD
jgi:hypothetical protein